MPLHIHKCVRTCTHPYACTHAYTKEQFILKQYKLEEERHGSFLWNCDTQRHQGKDVAVVDILNYILNS